MKTRPTRITHSSHTGQRKPFGLWIVACLAIAVQSMPIQAAPPTAADDIDYAASGFQLPPGVNPAEWATAAGVSAVGGMNYASQPAISGPMMGAPMMMNGMPGNGPVMARSPTLAQAAMMRQAARKQQQARGPRPPGALPMSGAQMGSPMSMMAMGMPGMGPNGPMMGRPGMEGPMMGPSQMQGAQMPGASSIPSSFPSGPIPGMGGVAPTGLQVPYGQNPYGVMPVGFQGQSYGCDGSCGDPACSAYAMNEYSSCGCDGGCDGACGGGDKRRFKGLLSMLSKNRNECNQCNGYGCKSCAEKSLQNDCIGYGGLFGDIVNGSCKNSDLGLMMGGIGSNLSMLSDCLSPYAEAGKCSQRWYDVSGEYMALSSNFSQGGGGVVTRQGGAPVLSYDDAGSSGLASGVRLSAALIMGVGGNVEVTYMGGHEWSDSASVTGAEDLFSFISDFGVTPAGGLDDTDRSLSQSLEAKTRFHSGEVNYRRRIVGPYCKFQGSWLFGMRYIRFDNDIAYDTVGTRDNGVGGIVGAPANGTVDTLRFFNSDVRTKNDYFGAQLGYDFWWNVTPGVHFGVEMKGAWMQNDWERNISLFANSAGPGATQGTANVSNRDRLGTVMGDLQATLLYRFSHEWSFRTSYHMMAIDDVVGNTLQAQTAGASPIDNLVNTPVDFGSAVVQGFTLGMEYLW